MCKAEAEMRENNTSREISEIAFVVIVSTISGKVGKIGVEAGEAVNRKKLKD